MCDHARRELLFRHENADRIRTKELCLDCSARVYGVFAHRLDDSGEIAWGPVGRWVFKVEPFAAVAPGS